MLKLPLHSLVVMVGPSGAGKSTFVSNTFESYEVVSSDAIRQELTGDFQNQNFNNIVFEEFHRRIRLKLQLGERVIADATHLRKKDRLKTAQIGVDFHVPVYYIIINRPLNEKLMTAGWRNDVPGLIERHDNLFNAQEKDILSGDGIASIIDLRDSAIRTGNTQKIQIVKKIDYHNIRYSLLDNDFTHIRVIGDVHGMSREFRNELKSALDNNEFIIQLGDIVDYGPDSISCVDMMYGVVMSGQGTMIIGNHEKKLEKYLIQKKAGDVKIQIVGGIVPTIDQIERLGEKRRTIFEHRFFTLMNHSRHHIVIGNKLFVHGSATSNMWKITSNRLSGFDEQRAVFAQVDTKVPAREDGYPNRIYDWVNEIPDNHTVYVGHDFLDIYNPVEKMGKLGGKAIFVDTGSGKERDGISGKLSSLVFKI